ncbi:MAG: hypothetical protein GY953_12785, partial [bacterium]|nr:hypothetical protein [bacterium]
MIQSIRVVFISLLALAASPAGPEHERLVDELARKVARADTENRARAIRDLQDLGPGSKAVPALVAALADPRDEVKAAAVSA